MRCSAKKRRPGKTQARHSQWLLLHQFALITLSAPLAMRLNFCTWFGLHACALHSLHFIDASSLNACILCAYARLCSPTCPLVCHQRRSLADCPALKYGSAHLVLMNSLFPSTPHFFQSQSLQSLLLLLSCVFAIYLAGTFHRKARLLAHRSLCVIRRWSIRLLSTTLKTTSTLLTSRHQNTRTFFFADVPVSCCKHSLREKNMALTKQVSGRNPNDFPALQLFLLGMPRHGFTAVLQSCSND